MLRRKLWRTAKVYKVQFISMILLIALGIGVFVGFNAEWVTIGKDTGAFFRDCGFADYRIIDEDGISSADVDKIRNLKGASLFLKEMYNSLYTKQKRTICAHSKQT